MTYKETLEFLYRQLPAYQRQGVSAFKKDLTNIRALLEFLDNPHHDFRSIHIAGTNGKGSVANMLTSVLMEAGYSTGLYTSPHLVDFRERIRLDGQMISKQAVLGFVRKIRPVLDGIQPSFFEITVAMAFYYFARKQVDVAIIETGLGGRLDSTNIIRPELSIITRIGLEHTAMLGDTLPAIAGEKAGIIKRNVPVVIGASQRGIVNVFKNKAKAENSTIHFADKTYDIINNNLSGNYRKIGLQKPGGESYNFQLDLLAAYQAENARTAFLALDVLNESGAYQVKRSQIRRGLKKVCANTRFAGRWQVIDRNPLVVLDGSHNADGFRQLGGQLNELHYDQLHIIFGCVGDKDLNSILPLLPKKAKYYLTAPPLDRAMPTVTLRGYFDAAGIPVEAVFPTPAEAMASLKPQISHDDLILVTGSLFLFSDFI